MGRDIGARIIVPIQLNIEKEHKIRGLEIHFCTCPNEKYSKCKDQFVVLPELDTKKCFHAPTQTATAKSVNSSELVILKLSERSRERAEVQTDSTEETENDFADFYHHFCPDKADKEISSALKGEAQHPG